MLIGRALAYVIELYRELTDENGAPTLGTQNQIVDFILADPELREAAAECGEAVETDEATTRAPKRHPLMPPIVESGTCRISYRLAGVYARPGQEPPRSALILAGSISTSLARGMARSVASTTPPACWSPDRRRSCILQICVPL
jgi:hypothetical protein